VLGRREGLCQVDFKHNLPIEDLGAIQPLQFRSGGLPLSYAHHLCFRPPAHACFSCNENVGISTAVTREK
jgi:hypothetical protein